MRRKQERACGQTKKAANKACRGNMTEHLVPVVAMFECRKFPPSEERKGHKLERGRRKERKVEGERKTRR
jgi:hypothetical protein